jgi:hypothetical protein
MTKISKIIGLTALIILLAAISTYAQEAQKIRDLKTEFLCELKAYLVKPYQMVGQGPHGTRMIAHTSGGTVKGPKLSGEVLPGPADWLLVRPDGAAQLDVRVTIRTDDGQLIYVQYRGISLIAPEVRQRIYKGESIDPSEYYFRTTPIFETGAEKYRWLNQVISVGVGTLGQNFVSYKIYVIR